MLHRVKVNLCGTSLSVQLGFPKTSDIFVFSVTCGAYYLLTCWVSPWDYVHFYLLKSSGRVSKLLLHVVWGEASFCCSEHATHLVLFNRSISSAGRVGTRLSTINLPCSGHLGCYQILLMFPNFPCQRVLLYPFVCVCKTHFNYPGWSLLNFPSFLYLVWEGGTRLYWRCEHTAIWCCF